MRGRRVLAVGLFFLALAVFAVYAAWAVRSGARAGFGADGLPSAWPYLAAGVLTVAIVLVGFVWLAFFSRNRGFDERANSDRD